jgi:hypothetical protein
MILPEDLRQQAHDLTHFDKVFAAFSLIVDLVLGPGGSDLLIQVARPK